MLILRSLAGSSFLALMAGTAVAQVTTVGTNRSEVQDKGRGNRAQVENSADGNDRNNSSIEFIGNDNRASTTQLGDDNHASTINSGDLNTAAIRQFGFRNRAVLHQIGNGNGSSVDQYLDPRIDLVGDRFAFVTQVGDNNSSSVVQVLWNNSATVMQGTSVQNPSNGGVSTILQTSAANVARVTMTGGSADARNRSHIEQTRIEPLVTNNDATVNVNGSFNISYLYQAGVRNTASHTVDGTQNTIIGRSYGDLMQSSVRQEGFRNLATISQFAGERNFSQIEQRGIGAGDRQISVLQGGSDNSSTIIQQSSGNNATVDQGGGSVSSLTQDGVGNFARAYMRDGAPNALNQSTITQAQATPQGPNESIGEPRHFADVTVRGLGNQSSVNQSGTRHAASVTLAGGGVGTNEAGRRNGNLVTVSQDRTLTTSLSGQQLPNSAGHIARVQVGLLQGGGVGTETSIQQLGQHVNIGNDAIVRQDGQYDRVSVLQSTRFSQVDGGASANISARGLLNQLTLNQFGRVFAFVTQGLGRESTFSASQYDSAGSRFADGFYAGGRGNNSIAASQYGDRNAADIWQEGTDNNVTVWQKTGSSDNSISINQGRNMFGIADEPCGLRCQFTSNALASGTQAGRFNRGSIIQYYTAFMGNGGGFMTTAGPKASIGQNGIGTATLPNLARISQFSTSGEATIFQGPDVGPSQAGDPSSGAPGDPGYFSGGARSAEARIRQDGGLSARIEQFGRGQNAFIDQRGANAASILQLVGATNATAIITQSGSGNSYNVVQTQPGQYINVSQTGTNNAVTNVITRP
jgi:hypothetical protein